VLAQGAVIKSEFDGIGRLKQRAVELAPGQSGRPGPSWVGGQPGVLLEKSFVYAQGPNPATKSDSHRALVNYRYDARERLLALEDDRGDGEHFVHDPTGNLYESGPGVPGRRYDGDRLLIRGNTRYEYDELGQLVTKVQTLDDGAELCWSYEWNLKQHLSAVVRPDGVRVEFTYDPFSRRTFKHVWSPDPLTGELSILRSTRYLWHLDQLVLERQIEPLLDGSLRETVTTYLYGDTAPNPLAQQRTLREHGTETKGEWLFLVGGQSEAPEELIDQSGAIVAHIDRSAYGVMVHRPDAKERTAVGFMGQFFDEETGLFYNRERYYDPEIGRFINHDPVGTASGTNLYHYTANPIGYGDPFGLKKHPLTVSVQFDGDDKATTEKFTSGRDTDDGKKWSDPGKSQWGTHTEPQAMNWLEDQEKKGKKLDGAKVKMEGASPPCLMCSKRMREFSNRTGATIEYTYPNGKKVKYSPNAEESPKPVKPRGEEVDPGVKNLCDNYNKHHDYREDKKASDESGGAPPAKPNYEPPPDPPPGAVTAKNPAWQSYQSEKAKSQSTEDDGLGEDPDME
jgi:RHS repeat-associated protein